VSIDQEAWRSVIIGAVRSLADESGQRRAWFGVGPEMGSPDEEVNQFLGDAAFAEYLDLADNGLDESQLAAGQRLLQQMRHFSESTPNILKPEDVIDDPKWKDVRHAARAFLTSLGENV
jgi:hypothetical protein